MHGNLLTGSDRRRAVRMDGMSRRELRKMERIDGRNVVCRLCGRIAHPDEMREGLCPDCDKETK